MNEADRIKIELMDEDDRIKIELFSYVDSNKGILYDNIKKTTCDKCTKLSNTLTKNEYKLCNCCSNFYCKHLLFDTENINESKKQTDVCQHIDLTNYKYCMWCRMYSIQGKLCYCEKWM